tara:strand:- start:764 stop:982 length:219 start_codon:yes stop_codon:yes gene_type:complete
MTVKTRQAIQKATNRKLKESNAKLEHILIGIDGILKICNVILKDVNKNEKNTKKSSDRHSSEHQSVSCKVCD